MLASTRMLYLAKGCDLNRVIGRVGISNSNLAFNSSEIRLIDRQGRK